MAGGLEDFLRQAAERHLAKKRGAARQPPAIPADKDIVDAEVIDAVAAGGVKSVSKPESLGSESVADHVEHHMDTSDIDQHAASLGKTIVSTHDAVEEHIQDTFDHDVGKLDHNVTHAYGNSKKVKPGEISELLQRLKTNKMQWRDAIILSEILRRPEGI